MAKLPRIKKRLLQGAIHANVELIAGRPPRAAMPRRAFFRTALRTAPLLLSLGAVSASSLLIANVTREAAPDPGVALRAGSRLGGAATDAASAPEMFSAPAGIDPRVFPLGIRRVIVDPGHGGVAVGTVTGKLRESHLTLDIAWRLRQKLTAAGFEVAMTRERDEDVELADRVDFANRNQGDVFVSIHVNWLETRAVRGVETYYLGATDDPYLTELASVENRDSGYSLTDFRRLLDGLYGGVRQKQSRQLAESVQRSIHRTLAKTIPKIQDRGVKTAPFVVLIGTDMPAILAEVSCLSNREDAEQLERPEHRQAIADALFLGIQNYSESLAAPSGSGPARRTPLVTAKGS